MFIYYFERLLSVVYVLIKEHKPLTALKLLRVPQNILSNHQILKGDQLYLILFKLYEKKAHCCSMSNKKLLALKYLKQAELNALKIKK